MSATAESLPSSFRRDTRIIGLVGTAHATSHFFHLIIVPLFPWLKAAFGLSYAELGLLMTVFFVVSGTGQALAGFLVDRVGAFPVLLGGIALCALSALSLAAAQNYAMLIAGAGIAGLGNSVFHPADFTLLSQRVTPARVPHAYSMHGLSGNIGWAIAPVFLAGIAAVAGWRAALLGGATIAIVVLLVLNANRELLHDAAAPHRARAAQKDDDHALAFLRLRGVWMCFAFFFITAIALGGVQTFGPAALHEIYATPLALATTSITVYMIFSGTGMLLGGHLAARTAHHDMVIAGAFLVAALSAALLGSGLADGMLMWVPIAIMGLAAGIAGPSRDLLVRAAAPRNATGRVFGVVYSGLDIGLSFAPLMFGALLDAHHPGWVFGLIGLFQAAALFTAFGVGRSAARRPHPA